MTCTHDSTCSAGIVACVRHYLSGHAGHCSSRSCSSSPGSFHCDKTHSRCESDYRRSTWRLPDRDQFESLFKKKIREFAGVFSECIKLKQNLRFFQISDLDQQAPGSL